MLVNVGYMTFFFLYVSLMIMPYSVTLNHRFQTLTFDENLVPQWSYIHVTESSPTLNDIVPPAYVMFLSRSILLMLLKPCVSKNCF